MEALFRAALLRGSSQRAAFLTSACAGDEGLRNEVAWLLTSDGQVNSGEPGVGPTAQVSHSVGTEEPSVSLEETVPASEKHAVFRRGESLGRYIVLERLGSGGMGVVYAAYDPELDRKVALKLLQREDSEDKAEQGQARMLREAQALARLSHPNIIPVFDVGTWGEQVFIAMEYLDGNTLKDWLGDGLRPWREVLSVFVPAGRGLAAAHASGLVHRDFKPSNVFIGKDGRVRVLDFGLARAADAKDTEPTPVDVFADTKMTPRAPALAATLTRSEHFMGTPAYMAPEQLMQLPTDVRTDQFAFCAALYEGLYGARPFGADKLEALIFEVTRGKVKEAPKSSKVPAWVRAILLHGLQPNPQARYPSMDALLTELEKDPAIPRGRWMRTAGVVLLIAVAVLGYRQVRHQQSQLCKGAEQELAGIWNPEKRDAISRVFLATGKPYAQDAVNGVGKALDSYTQSWVAMHTEACEATRLKGKQSEELLDLRMQCLSQRRQELKSLVDIFTSADAKVVENSVQAAQALTRLDGCADATALKAPMRPPADAATRAKVDDLRQKLATAKALQDAGKYREGLAVTTVAATEAKALRYRPVEAEALYLLAGLQGSTFNRKLAEQTLNEAALAAEGGRHDELSVQAWIGLVGARRGLDRYDEAHDSGKHAYAALERLGGNEYMLAKLLVQLGNVFNSQGKYDEALAHHQRAEAIRERMGPDYPNSLPELLVSLNSFGWVLQTRGNYEQALDYFQRALTAVERTLGPAHPKNAGVLMQIGDVLDNLGRYEQALGYLQRALDILERTVGSINETTAEDLSKLGWVLLHQGKYSDALASFQRSLAFYERFSPANRAAIHPLGGVGIVLELQGKYHEALVNWRRALAIIERAMGPQHADMASALSEIGSVLLRQRKYRDALSHLERARALFEEAKGPTHAGLAPIRSLLGDVLMAQKKYGEALDQYKGAVAINEKAFGPEHPDVAQTLTRIGRTYLELRELGKAIGALERALSIHESRPGDPNYLAETRFALARALGRMGGDQSRALSLASAARETFAAARGIRKKDLLEVDRWLAGKR